jgi:hypothetical protein
MFEDLRLRVRSGKPAQNRNVEKRDWMETFLRVVAGLLLIAHGLVHLLFLVPDVKEFTLEDSWLVSGSASQPMGNLLMAATVVGFVLLGLAVWGVPVLSDAFPAIAIVASVVSLVLLVTFWDIHLVFGLVLDIALITLALVHPSWTQHIA